ncbi:MAG: CopG family transcriptional regulator [Synechococcaceae cyanobacterium SM2_3_1]|nr:CopG family transcriptional regulator [Synechococcaceae cyanobacterium SM2_3_1]
MLSSPHHSIDYMRTTVSIDDDLLLAAKALASQRQVSVGRVLSDLIRKGLSAEAQVEPGSGGFPVFKIPANARPITLDTVKKAEDEL